jgi:hypothetical protein
MGNIAVSHCEQWVTCVLWRHPSCVETLCVKKLGRLIGRFPYLEQKYRHMLRCAIHRVSHVLLDILTLHRERT